LPCLKSTQRCVDFLLHQQEFGEQHFLPRTIAEVGVHRVGEGVAIVEQHFAQGSQVRCARFPRRIRRAPIRMALLAKQRFERGDFRQIVLHCSSLPDERGALGPRAYRCCQCSNLKPEKPFR